MDKHRFPLIIEAREIYPGWFQGDSSKLLQVYLHLDMNYRLGDIEPLQRLQDLTNYSDKYRMVRLHLPLIPQNRLEAHHKPFVPLLQPLV